MKHRWIFLIFSSLTFFAAELFGSQGAPLVSRLQGTAEDCLTGKDKTCLNFTATQFNSLYVAQSWAGGLTAVLSGFFIGRYGVWLISCVSAVCLFIGMLLFTLGPYLATDAAFAIMLCGSLTFAVGCFAQTTLSHQVKSHWFYGKELALAFTIYVVLCRIGAIVALAAVGSLTEVVGLQMTLWIIFCICLLAPLCAMISGWIYRKYASVSLDLALFMDTNGPGQFGFYKVFHLGHQFWIVSGILFFFMGALVTMMADTPKFLIERYGYSEAAAGQITGLIADIGISAPIFGYLIDKFGRRDVFNVVGTGFFFIGMLGLAAVKDFRVAVANTFLGLAQSILLAGIWGSIPVITSPDCVGVAMGMGIGIQAFAGGLLLLITGALLDNTTLSSDARWQDFFILLATCAGVTWLLSGVSFYLDTRTPNRPLRNIHTLPAISAEMNPAADECSPLMPGSRMSRASTNSQNQIYRTGTMDY